jgi:hypothetical protein
MGPLSMTQVNTRQLLEAIESKLQKMKTDNEHTKEIMGKINAHVDVAQIQVLLSNLEEESKRIEKTLEKITEAKDMINKLRRDSTRQAAHDYLVNLTFVDFINMLKVHHLDLAKNNLRAKKIIYELFNRRVGLESQRPRRENAEPRREVPENEREVEQIFEDIQANLPEMRQDLIEHIETDEGRREFNEFVEMVAEQNPGADTQQLANNPLIHSQFALANENFRNKLVEKHGEDKLHRHAEHIDRFRETMQRQQERPPEPRRSEENFRRPEPRQSFGDEDDFEGQLPEDLMRRVRQQRANGPARQRRGPIPREVRDQHQERPIPGRGPVQREVRDQHHERPLPEDLRRELEEALRNQERPRRAPEER